MNAPWDVPAPPITALRRLARFLRQSGSTLSPKQAAAQAIDQWIAAAKGHNPALAATPSRGYQWKTLFLPEGSQLRMRHGGASYYAHVQGDALLYAGQAVSPRQMALAVAGEGRNAWREMAVLLPGAATWKPAALLRRQAGQALEQAPPEPVAPLQAMEAAASCMTQALQAALALVEHANEQALPRLDRRVTRHRRTEDLMVDDCKLD